jgi:hypothetical protein
MAGGDLDAARRLHVTDGQSTRWRRRHADVGHSAANTGQTGKDGIAEHCTAGSSISTQHDGLALDMGSQSGAKAASQLRRQAGADNAPDSRDADYQLSRPVTPTHAAYPSSLMLGIDSVIVRWIDPMSALFQFLRNSASADHV